MTQMQALTGFYMPVHNLNKFKKIINLPQIQFPTKQIIFKGLDKETNFIYAVVDEIVSDETKLTVSTIHRCMIVSANNTTLCQYLLRQIEYYQLLENMKTDGVIFADISNLFDLEERNIKYETVVIVELDDVPMEYIEKIMSIEKEVVA